MEQEQLDPSIIALSKAIGHQESGGNYNKIGDNGHSKGAYQWNNKTPLKEGEIPANFRSFASEVDADTEDFSPANQDRVAYKTIEKWGKQGLTPAQISSKWNSGGADTYKTAKPEYNVEQGINYDVKKYVDNVAKYYEEFNKGNQAQISSGPNVKTSDNDLTKDKIVSSEPVQSNQPSGITGTKPNDSLYGKIINNSLTRGIMNTGDFLSFGGAKQLGNQVGTSLAAIPAAAKDLVTGKNESQYHKQPDLKETAKGTGKVVGGVLSLVGGKKGADLVSGIFKGKSAIVNPEVINILKGSVGKGETIANLSRKDAVNTLGNYLKEMSVSQSGGKTEQLVLKALKELSPTLIEQKSLFNKLMKGGWDLAKSYALLQLLGNKVGGFVDRSIK